ncbi:hypothetical protein ACFOHT_04865 [Massilia oculi]|uniref:hypothetical protein n=1 Tax=Massilia oculi TaxID=945844 RepID=UPI003613027B
MTLKTFAPSGADTVTLAATTTSARVQIDPNSSVVRVVNDGTATAFLHFGDVTVASNAAKMPIKAGATETFTTGTASHVAAVTASGTTNLYFTNGEGL